MSNEILFINLLVGKNRKRRIGQGSILRIHLNTSDGLLCRFPVTYILVCNVVLPEGLYEASCSSFSAPAEAVFFWVVLLYVVMLMMQLYH